MEKKIVLASHGHFASGILSSLRIICGENPAVQIEALDCYTTQNFDLAQAVAKVMEQSNEEELVVVTDIFGGSVNNEFSTYIERSNFYLIAGLNLPFLIELATKIGFTASTDRLIAEALEEAKDSIQFCNETLSQQVAEEDF